MLGRKSKFIIDNKYKRKLVLEPFQNMVLSANEFLTKTSVVVKFCLLIMLTDVNSRLQTTFTQILNSIYFPHNEGGKIIFNTDN